MGRVGNISEKKYVTWHSSRSSTLSAIRWADQTKNNIMGSHKNHDVFFAYILKAGKQVFKTNQVTCYLDQLWDS